METFRLLEFHQLKNIVQDMPNKNSSVDGITARIVKISFEAVGDKFLQVVNTSLEKGEFPKKWKKSMVIPIDKIKNTIQCEEFRPINMVPSYEKLLELIVSEQLVEYVENNSLLTKFQAGFRHNNSCESALQTVLVDWKSAINNRKVVGIVFLDFQRAFETINRELLLLKMEKMGIGGYVLKWFQEYLCDRVQCTKYNNSVSSEKNTQFGVPQGTVLGPKLFIMYINDIVLHVKRCQIQLFADDTLLFSVGENVKSVIEDLNYDLKNLYRWLTDNNLKLNINKTKFMIVKNKYLMTNTNTDGVVINTNKIEQVKETKYLGVIIDEHLSFSKHATYITNKVAKKVNVLGRIGHNLTQWTKQTIYRSIINPHFQYCSTILFLLSNSEINVLQKKQNQALRIILKCNRYTSINSMLDRVNMFSVKQILTLNTLIFIFKILHGLLPEHLLDHCTFVNEIHDHFTRTNNNLYVQTVRTNYAQNDIFHKGLIMYNSLPREMTNCNSISKFKKLCYKYVKENVTRV